MTASAVPRSYDPPALALEHVRTGRYREAVAVCRERLAEDPGDVGALRLLSRVLLHSGHGALATLLLEQAVKASPDEPVLLVDLGAALRSMESDDDAAAAYERALAADPASTEAFFGLLELGRLGELEARLQSAAELAPAIRRRGSRSRTSCWRPAATKPPARRSIAPSSSTRATGTGT